MFFDDVVNSPSPSRPPNKLMMLGESRVVLNVAGMAKTLLAGALKPAKPSNGRTIIMLPGFGSDERYMEPLAKFLRNNGYKAEGWGLGLNMGGADLEHTLDDLSPAWSVEPMPGYDPATYKGEGGVPYLCDLAIASVKARAEQLGTKVTLVGWSLGGYIAREVARDLPGYVDQVVTMGSPVIGGPKYTAAALFFDRKGHDLDWVEREAGKRDLRPIQQPITAIYSKSDAIVDWRAAIDKFSPNVKHIKVSAPHLGMGFNSEIWNLVLAAVDERN